MRWCLMWIVISAGFGAKDVHWNWETPSTHGHDLYDMAYFSGRFVAISAAGVIMTTTDLSSWSYASSPTTHALYHLEIVGTDLVAVGEAGTILTSADGLNWVAQSSGVSDLLTGITTNGSLTLVGTDNGKILMSTNLSQWTAVGVGVEAVRELLWTGTKFAAVKYDSVGLSADGSSWSWHASGSIGPLQGLCWTGSDFYAVDINAVVHKSGNGISWTNAGSTGTLYGQGLETHAGYLFTFGDSKIRRSTNGSSWSNVATLSIGKSVNGIIEQGGDLFAFGTAGLVMDGGAAGTSWSNLNAGSLAIDFNDITSNGSELVGVGPDHISYHGGIGGTWMDSGYPADSWNRVIFDPANQRFIAVADSGNIAESTDGISWTDDSSPTALPLMGIAASPSAAVAVGVAGTILRSQASGPWVAQISPTPLNIFDVVWDGQRFLACGDDATLITSTDGVTWTTLSTGTFMDSFFALATDGVNIVMVGTLKLYTSLNGGGPIFVSQTASSGFRDVFWDGYRFLAWSEFGHGAWMSQSGAYWKPTGGPEWGLIQAAYFDGETYTGVGQFGRTLTVGAPNLFGETEFAFLSIPDADPTGLVSTLSSASTTEYVSIRVRVRLRHTYITDLLIKLRHEGSGKEVVLLNGAQTALGTACYADNLDIVFDDDAEYDAASACLNQVPAVVGRLKPQQALSAFNSFDDPHMADWSLVVVDQVPVDGGSLDWWSIDFKGFAFQCGGSQMVLNASQLNRPDSIYEWQFDGAPIGDRATPQWTESSPNRASSGRYECILHTGAASDKIFDTMVTVSPDLLVFSERVVAQGLMPTGLYAEVFSCNGTFTWTDLNTQQTWTDLQILVSPSVTTQYEARLQENGEVATRSSTVLVASHPTFLDTNGDGCNNLDDWRSMYSAWHQPVVPDPSGDQFIDVRDYLYLSLFHEGGPCP